MKMLVLIAALLASSPADAMPCWLVRATFAPFAKHGVAMAEKWARDHGYSEAEIKEAKKCLR